MADECPYPDGAEIQFAQHARTGKVHVMRYAPDARDSESWEPVAWTDLTPEQKLDAIVGRVRVLCGYQAATAPGGGLTYVGREHFADEQLCARCVPLLGDGQARAFGQPYLTDEEGPSDDS